GAAAAGAGHLGGLHARDGPFSRPHRHAGVRPRLPPGGAAAGAERRGRRLLPASVQRRARCRRLPVSRHAAPGAGGASGADDGPADHRFVRVLPGASHADAGGDGMKRLRRVTEAEVISEFLRNEFYSEEFQHDRTRFESLVLEPDLGNEHENAVRRALLFRRRGHMWRELPTDTAWW